MVFVLEIHHAQWVFIMKKVNASPAPPIAHPANHNQSVRLVYLDSN